MTMMKMLGRRVIPSTYFSLRCCFFSTSATLLSRADYVGKGLSKDDCVAPAAVSDGVLVDEVVSELQAGFLQPRVVVYDGGCRFCHNGLSLSLSLYIYIYIYIYICCCLSIFHIVLLLLIKRLIKIDKFRKIKLCYLQSQVDEQYMDYCGVDRESVLRHFLFIEGPNTFSQGSTSALRVASYLPLPYSALKVLLIIPAPVRDAVYDYVAKHRYDWFGKQEDCEALQDPEVHQRFVDRKEIWDRCREKYHEDQSTRHSLSAV
ncbi:hypothetical protein MKX01_026582 [Papaver californicum]|nr:hypothetical protein MKX01_026582 [Papaver californicum]